MGNVSWTDIVAAVVVIYGAVLSTYNLFRELRSDRPRGKVTFSYAVRVGYGDEPRQIVMVTFCNIGRTRINVQEVGIALPDNSKALFPRGEFPALLEPQDSLTAVAEISELKTVLSRSGQVGTIRMRGYCRDATSRYYYGKRTSFGIS